MSALRAILFNERAYNYDQNHGCELLYSIQLFFNESEKDFF